MSDRDELRDELSGWPIGAGYYQSMVGSDDAGEMADTIVASDWLARVKREAAADALAGAATSIEPFSGIGLANGATRAEVAGWLRARAAEYREEPK